MNTQPKIAKVETYDVAVPFRAPMQSGGSGQRLRPDFPTLSIDEQEPGNGLPGPAMERTIIALHTSEGLVGLGEGPPAPAGDFAPLVGQNPFCLEDIHLRYPGEENHRWATVEMACLDLQGKVLDQPLCKLLHGEDIKPRVAHSAYCFFRTPNREGENGVTPEKLEKYRWTPEKHEENQRIRAELIERYQVVPADTWRPDLGRYPYY